MWLKSQVLIIIVFITINFLLVSERSEARQISHHRHYNSISKHHGNGGGHSNGNGNDIDDYDDGDDDSSEPGTKAELQKIDFLLQVMFDQDSFSSQCESKGAARINARDCLIGLAYGLGASRPYSCEFFQGEYDCLVYALKGCFDRALDLQRFYQLQQDFAQEYNCTIASDRDSQSPIDEYHPRKVPHGHTKPKSKSHSNGNNGGEHHSMHRRQINFITIHNDSTTENSKDDHHVVQDVLSRAGFYFVWL